MTDLRASIAAFLATRPHGVVSTVHADGSVESALVAFSETPELDITFGTFDTTRKFANILRDPRVAFVVTDDENVEVQLEGRARIAEGEEHERCKRRHLAKNPKTAKYADDPHQRFVVIEPTWIRFIDRRTDPTTAEELRF
jgi:general stress protein 26